MRLAMTFLSAASLAAVALTPAVASAGVWAQNHPRQAQVLRHEHHQLRRINEERREGELTRGEARALRAADRNVVWQERAFARANGGYITRGQQRELNAELNAQHRLMPY